MVLISTSLSLLAIVAGMHLLALTNKENLGRFFKLTSYFIVIVGFLSIACIGARGMMHCGFRGQGPCEKRDKCEAMDEGYNKRCEMGSRMHCPDMMRNNCCMSKMMHCREMMENNCDRNKMRCCNKMEEQDSIMDKKGMKCDEEIGFQHKCHSNEIKKEK